MENNQNSRKLFVTSELWPAEIVNKLRASKKLILNLDKKIYLIEAFKSPIKVQGHKIDNKLIEKKYINQ